MVAESHPLLLIRGVNERLSGYKYFWMKSVVGFDPANHCAKCLKGAWMSGVTPRMIINRPIELKPWNSSVVGYLCGVAEGHEWAKNLHLPFERTPGNVERMTLVGGEKLTLVNGRRLEIPALPRGWAGLGSRFTTCRNFQFAVSHFGINEQTVRAVHSPGSVTSG